MMIYVLLYHIKITNSLELKRCNDYKINVFFVSCMFYTFFIVCMLIIPIWNYFPLIKYQYFIHSHFSRIKSQGVSFHRIGYEEEPGFARLTPSTSVIPSAMDSSIMEKQMTMSVTMDILLLRFFHLDVCALMLRPTLRLSCYISLYMDCRNRVLLLFIRRPMFQYQMTPRIQRDSAMQMHSFN